MFVIAVTLTPLTIVITNIKIYITTHRDATLHNRIFSIFVAFFILQLLSSSPFNYAAHFADYRDYVWQICDKNIPCLTNSSTEQNLNKQKIYIIKAVYLPLNASFFFVAAAIIFLLLEAFLH
jgi:Fe2+ transport system protein B